MKVLRGIFGSVAGGGNARFHLSLIVFTLASCLTSVGVAQSFGTVLQSLGGGQGETVFDGKRTPFGVFVVGVTGSTDFPVKNAFQSTFAGDPEGLGDLFVARLDADSLEIIWATYLGGSGTDVGNGLVVDDEGNVTISGYTTSADFPTRAALQGALGGASDGIVARFTVDGELLFSSYYGGSSDDQFSDIGRDDFGRGFALVGFSNSEDFPFPEENASSADTSCGCSAGRGTDGVVVAFNPEGEVQWSTFLGGTGGEDIIFGTDVRDNRVYVVGRSNDPAFPDRTLFGRHGGGYDAFWVEYDQTEGVRVNSRLRGGSGDEEARAVHGGFVVGRTTSMDFPIANGAVQPEFGGGESDGFIAFFSGRNFGSLSTYLGGSGDDELRAIDLFLDERGTVDRTIFVAGTTTSDSISEASGAVLADSVAGKGGLLAQFEQPVTGDSSVSLRKINLDIVRSPGAEWDGNWVDGFVLPVDTGEAGSLWGGASDDPGQGTMIGFNGTVLAGFGPVRADVAVSLEYLAAGQSAIRVVVRNEGPSEAAGVKFDVELNSSVKGIRKFSSDGVEIPLSEFFESCKFESIDSGGGFVTPVSVKLADFDSPETLPEFNLVTCQLGSMKVGDPGEVTFVVALDPFGLLDETSNPLEEFRLRATGSAFTTTPESQLENNIRTFSDLVRREALSPQVADVEVRMTPLMAVVGSESVHRFEVSVGNLGPALAENTEVVIDANTWVRSLALDIPSLALGFDSDVDSMLEFVRLNCQLNRVDPVTGAVSMVNPVFDRIDGVFFARFNQIVWRVGDLPAGDGHRQTMRLQIEPHEDDRFRIAEQGLFKADARATSSTIDAQAANDAVQREAAIPNFPGVADYAVHGLEQQHVESSEPAPLGKLRTRFIVSVTETPADLRDELAPIVMRVHHGGNPEQLQLVARPLGADADTAFSEILPQGLFCVEIDDHLTECVIEPQLVIDRGGQVLLEVLDVVTGEVEPAVEVSLSGDGQDPVLVNNFARLVTQLVDLDVVVKQQRRTVGHFDGLPVLYVEYQIEVTNHGPSAVGEIRLQPKTMVDPDAGRVDFAIGESLMSLANEVFPSSVAVTTLPEPFEATLECPTILDTAGLLTPVESENCIFDGMLASGATGTAIGTMILRQKADATRIPPTLGYSFEVNSGDGTKDPRTFNNSVMSTIEVPIEGESRNLAVTIPSLRAELALVEGQVRLIGRGLVRVTNVGLLKVEESFLLHNRRLDFNGSAGAFSSLKDLRLERLGENGLIDSDPVALVRLDSLAPGESIELKVWGEMGARAILDKLARLDVGLVVTDGFERDLSDNRAIKSARYETPLDLAIEHFETELVARPDGNGGEVRLLRTRIRVINRSDSFSFENVSLTIRRQGEFAVASDVIREISLTEPRPDCDDLGDILCGWIQIPPESVYEFEFLDKVIEPAEAGSRLTVTATLRSSTEDETLENNSREKTVSLGGFSDVLVEAVTCRIVRVPNSDPLRVLVEWGLFVSNPGPAAAENVRLLLAPELRTGRLLRPSLVSSTPAAFLSDEDVISIGRLESGGLHGFVFRHDLAAPESSGELVMGARVETDSAEIRTDNNLDQISCEYLALLRFEQLRGSLSEGPLLRLLLNGQVGGRYRIESAGSVTGPWAPFRSAVGDGSLLELELPGNQRSGFFRIVVDRESASGD